MEGKVEMLASRAQGDGYIDAAVDHHVASRRCLSGTLALSIGCQNRQAEPIYRQCRHYHPVYQSDEARHNSPSVSQSVRPVDLFD